MESEADLRARFAVAATTSDSVTISSTFTSSPPAFRRDVREFFKRHRPFNKTRGTFGPSRMVAPQQGSGSTSGGSDISDDARLVECKVGMNMTTGRKESKDTCSMIGEDRASVTPPYMLPAQTYEHSGSLIIEQEYVQKEYVRSVRDGTSAGPSYADYRQLEEDGDEQKLHSSAADIKIPETNQMEVSAVISRDVSQVGVPYIEDKRITGVKDHSHAFGNFLNQPTTHSSVAGSSCTTMLGNSTTVPMITSTTCCSYVNRDGNSPHAHECSNANLQLAGSRDAFGLNSGLQSNQEALSISKPSVLETNVAEKNFARDVEQPAQADKPKIGAGANKSVKWKGDGGDGIELQSQAPSAKTSSTDLYPKREKPEGSATDNGLPAPRKRSSNSDAFFKVNGKLYQKLGKIGSGGSSEVHKVISSDCNIYALKKIRLKGRDYATAFGFCQEILYLNKLKGRSNIIQLIDFEVTDKGLLQEVMAGSMSNKDSKVKDDGYIFMVLEYGEIDLAHMLSQKWKEIDNHDQTIDENWLRFYWQQILLAVNTIHEERIVHSDLKPANFLLVRGSLKLIDFGIAKAIMSDTTNIQRDSQVGTLSYMSPEAFMCNETDADGNTIKCGRPSDIWSLGCILYQMVYGRTPFAEHKTFWAKFKVITDPNHEIKYPPLPNPYLLDLMKKCLAWDRDKRWRIPQLLEHPFIRPPIPHPSCSPSQTCKLIRLITEACTTEQEASTLRQHLIKLIASSTNSRLHIQKTNSSRSPSSSKTHSYEFTFCSNN